jgi:16S rRNA (guanine527-N7)-methyltransferase
MSCAKTIQAGLTDLEIHIDPAAVSSLCIYHEELMKWSRKMNLVAKAGEIEILETHFLDSLTLLPLLSSARNLMDVGTGAGFPGLALKAVLPDLEVTLVEPRQKRVSFLKHIIRTLQLYGISVVNDRLDTNKILPDLAGRFQVVTSRAFTSIKDFLELAQPYVAEDGCVICMKGPAATKEISGWQQDQPESRYDLLKVHTLKLPFSGKERNLLEFRIKK